MSHAIFSASSASRTAASALLLLIFLGFASVSGATQDVSEPHPDPQFGPHRGASDFEAKAEQERMKARNKDRFESLKRDTDRLLQLSTELKQSVDKASENTLSLEVIRKTEEVEKLAKKVREKMKAESLMPGPTIQPQH